MPRTLASAALAETLGQGKGEARVETATSMKLTSHVLCRLAPPADDSSQPSYTSLARLGQDDIAEPSSVGELLLKSLAFWDAVDLSLQPGSVLICLLSLICVYRVAFASTEPVLRLPKDVVRTSFNGFAGVHSTFFNKSQN